MTNKYEQLIELIINEEQDKARELFHEIVVEKSRDIYESLIDETDVQEVEDTGTEIEELSNDIAIDEQGISEEEGEEGEEDADMDFDDSGEEDEHEEHHGDLEDRVMDVEDAIDELKAEFDALMAGEVSEPEHAEVPMPEAGMMEGADEEEEEKVEESEEEIVREYVEKAPAPTTSEEGAVNKSTPVAGKNDMGGTSVDVTKGGNVDPNGTKPQAGAKPKGELIGKNHSTPGGDAGKAFATKETAVKGEEGGVNKTAPVAK